MSLSVSQYNSIMREYEALQARNFRDQQARREKAYELVPKLKELESRAASSALKRYRAYKEQGNTHLIDGFAAELEGMAGEKARLLAQAGLPADMLEMHYTCPLCQDTGLIEGKKCRCFRAREIKLLYAQSNLEELLGKHNFDTLSFDCYDPELKLPVGLSQREYMEKVVRFLKKYCDEFDEKGGSILFTGATGLGKSFLSRCIAGELIGSYHSVIFLSAIQLFDVIEKVKFEKTEDPSVRGVYDSLTECDLLIIDDLGSEVINTMTNSGLFYILDSRINSQRPMIMNTNLSMNMLRDVYTERITSRLRSSFDIIPLYGADIREL